MTEQNQEQVKQNLQDTNQWIRILYMVLFWIVLYFSIMVTGVLVFIQVLFSLVTGSDNKNLREFSAGLTKYINQILLFVTYNEERKPFPFAAWGELEEAGSIEAETTVETGENDISTETSVEKYIRSQEGK
mgnify:CR=1 FL=1